MISRVGKSHYRNSLLLFTFPILSKLHTKFNVNFIDFIYRKFVYRLKLNNLTRTKCVERKREVNYRKLENLNTSQAKYLHIKEYIERICVYRMNILFDSALLSYVAMRRKLFMHLQRDV